MPDDGFPLASPEEIAQALEKVKGFERSILEARARIQQAYSDIGIPKACPHRWSILAVKTPDYVPAHPRLGNLATTVVLVKCDICGLPDTVDLNGVWTEDQVRRKAEGDVLQARRRYPGLG